METILTEYDLSTYNPSVGKYSNVLSTVSNVRFHIRLTGATNPSQVVKLTLQVSDGNEYVDLVDKKGKTISLNAIGNSQFSRNYIGIGSGKLRVLVEPQGNCDGLLNINTYQRVEAANSAPTDITLSANTIAENNSIGDVIGSFSTTDANTGDTFTYELVTGTGDTDNASFTIEGANLKAAEVFDYETKSNYSIRVKVTDAGGLSFEKSFGITVTDVVENTAPSNVTLSPDTINEGNSIGDVIGTLSTIDADVGDTFTYTLVSGTGDTDNGSFTIVGDELRAAEVFDYETKTNYLIRVRSTDSGGLFVETQFTVVVNDVAETPMNETNLLDLGLSSTEIDNRLIYIATLNLTGQVIDIRGNSSRTSASDDAVKTLTETQDNHIWEDV